MIARGTRRERRAVLAGAAIVGVILALGRGLPAWARWVSVAEASERELRAEVVRARSAVAGSKAASDSLAARSTRLAALAPMFLDGRTPNVAVASLAAAVSRIAQDAGLRVASIGTRADTSKRAMPRAVASLTAVGDVRGLVRLLVATERGPVLMAVTSLSITQADVAATDDRPEALRIEMTIEALLSARPERLE